MPFLNGFTYNIYSKITAGISDLGYNIYILCQVLIDIPSLPKRFKEFLNQVETSAFGGFPVAMIVAIFTGMVLAFQSGIELARFKQEANIGLLVSASMCREMGPVMTGYILAGLIGSTMAAELGTMKVSEEIDALETMSIDPIKFLVLPRVLAMALVGPLLTIYTNVIGVLGGAFVASVILNVNLNVYFRSALDALTLKDIYSGLTKALVFGITIAIVGCTQGLRAEGGAAGVGKTTMRAVVIAFIAVLVFDYLLTWFFY